MKDLPIKDLEISDKYLEDAKHMTSVEAILEETRSKATQLTLDMEELEKRKSAVESYLFSCSESEIQRIIDERVKEIEKQNADYNNLATVAGLSHYYVQAEKQAEKAYWVWTCVAIVFMLFSIVFAVFQLENTANMALSNIVGRALITTGILSIATYCARQASKQDKVKRYTQKMWLEMLSAKKFIEDLPLGKQEEVISMLALKSFGNPESCELSNKSANNVASSQSAVMELMLATIVKNCNN